MKRLFFPKHNTEPRGGFTLLELVIVISLILVLLTITVAAVSFNNEADRVRFGARQVQSFLLGARDRAVHSGEEVGVRFYFGQPGSGADATTRQIITRQVSSLAYIGRSGTWPPEAGHKITVQYNDINGDLDQNDAFELSIFDAPGSPSNSSWWNLKRKGWLVDGLRIRIPDSPTGSWYQVDTSRIDITLPPPIKSELRMASPNAGKLNRNRAYSYLLELPFSMLPEEPCILPENVVIDLDGSRVPISWRPIPGTGLYNAFADIIFSPRGNVTGDASATGLLHFYVCDSEDSLFLKEQRVKRYHGNSIGAFDHEVKSVQKFVPMDELNQDWVGGAYNVKPRRLVTVNPLRGAVSIHDVHAYIDPEIAPDPGDQNGDGIADDPFRFAETGEAAN